MRIGKIIVAFLRGVVKGFPLGNAIIEGVNTVKGGIVKDIVTPAGETVTGIVKDPHNWISIIVQVATILALAYGVYTHTIDINKVIETLQGLKQ